MLAKVHVAMHSFSPGYGMLMRMSSLIKQKVILKDRIHYPKKNAHFIKDTMLSKETTSNQGNSSTLDKTQTHNTSANQGKHSNSSTPDNVMTRVPKNNPTSNIRKFNSVIVAALDSFFLTLDKIITTSQELTDDKEESRIFS